MIVNLNAVRGEFAGVFDGAAHRAAFFHLDRAGGQLVGANHFGGIEGDFLLALTVTDGQVTTTDAEAVTSALLMPLTVSLPVSGSYSITAQPGNATRQPSADADGAGRGGKIIVVNAGQDKGGIELAANGQQ